MTEEHVTIQQTRETDRGWEFTVAFNGRTFLVTLDREYYQHLTRERQTPAQLIQHSFAFLLKREPVTSILQAFDLSQIQQYFPEYESYIRR